jgi:hypothetical protein
MKRKDTIEAGDFIYLDDTPYCYTDYQLIPVDRSLKPLEIKIIKAVKE